MPKNAHRAETIDYRLVKNALFSHKLLCFAYVFFFMVGAVAYTFIARPTYRAQASVLIENKSASIVGQAGEGVSVSRDVTQAQQSLANSPPILNRAAAQVRTTEWEEVKSAEIADPLIPYEEDRVSAIVQGQLLVLRVLNQDPEKSAQLANAWAAAFVDEMNRRESAGAVYASEFLSDNLPAKQDEWLKAVDALHQFQKETRFDPKEAEKHPLNQHYAYLGQQLKETQVRHARIQAESESWKAAQSDMNRMFQHSRARHDHSVKALETMVLEQMKSVGELRQKYLPDSLKVKQAQQMLTDLETRAKTTLLAIGSQLQVDLEAVGIEMEKLTAMYDQAKAESEKLKSNAAEYHRLAVRLEMTRQQYETYTQRQSNANVEKKVNYSYAKFWERALVPKKPYRPSLPINLVIGALLSILLSATTIYYLESADDRVRDLDRFQKQTGRTALGSIPVVEKRFVKNLYHLAKSSPRAVPVEHMRTIRASLSVAMGTRAPVPGKSASGALVLVTSAGEADGKSVLSSNLAYLLAQAGQKVLLIDMDLYKATLSREFGFAKAPGISDLGDDPASLDALIQPTDTPGFLFLPAGGHAENPGSIIESTPFNQFLAQARVSYDFVVLDASPVLLVADASVIAQSCDAVLLVIRSRKTRLAQVERAEEVLLNAKAPQPMFIVNGISGNDMEAGGYGYGYGYGASYGSFDSVKDKSRKSAVPQL